MIFTWLGLPKCPPGARGSPGSAGGSGRHRHQEGAFLSGAAVTEVTTNLQAAWGVIWILIPLPTPRSHFKTSQTGYLLKNNPSFSLLFSIFLYIIPYLMHQKQNQTSQGLVRQFHWKTAQGLSNKGLWESLYSYESQSFISVCSSCPLDQSTPKLCENKARPSDHIYKHYTQT